VKARGVTTNKGLACGSGHANTIGPIDRNRPGRKVPSRRRELSIDVGLAPYYK